MRHPRISNQRNHKNNLSVFKKQISIIIQTIKKLNETDKNDAINYTRQLLNDIESSKLQEKLQENILVEEVEERSEDDPVPNPRTKSRSSKRRKSVIRKPHKLIKKTFLKCTTCNETKNTKNGLLKHMELHIGTPISCLLCRETFNSITSFEWHLIHTCKGRKTSSKQFQCPECPQVFTVQRHLNLHLEGHKRNNCSYCDTVLTRRDHLIQHMLDVHNIKMQRSIFICDYCDKRLVKRQSLFYHLRQHLPNKHVCMKCGNISNSNEEHTEHLKMHEEQKPWQCPRCNVKFSRKQQYLLHLKRHDQYKCLTCNESFAAKAPVYMHYKRGHLVHGLEPQLHCPHCPAAFHRTLLLQMHIRKHKEESTAITCKFCDKIFHTPYQYYKHCKTTIHDKNSPEISQLVCENCGKQFTKKYVLEQHLQRYHGAKRSIQSCKYCDYKTQFKMNFERHMKLHFSKNEYMCDHCGKTFSNLSGLTDHIGYIHTQEKQFKCSDCDKCFKRNSELVRHRSCHSDARPHACSLCGQTYKRMNHLRRHEAKAHKLVGKSKQVQRLETDSTGAVISVPMEKSEAAQNITMQSSSTTTPDTIFTFTNNEFLDSSVIHSISLPKTIVNEDLVSLDESEFIQSEFWTDKLNIPVQKVDSIIFNTDLSSLPQISTLSTHPSNLHAFNIVDQFVKSLLPTKELAIINGDEYDYSTSAVLDYENIVSAINKENEMLTPNDKLELNDLTW